MQFFKALKKIFCSLLYLPFSCALKVNDSKKSQRYLSVCCELRGMDRIEYITAYQGGRGDHPYFTVPLPQAHEYLLIYMQLRAEWGRADIFLSNVSIFIFKNNSTFKILLMFEHKFIFASAVTVLNTRNTYYVNKL